MTHPKDADRLGGWGGGNIWREIRHSDLSTVRRMLK